MPRMTKQEVQCRQMLGDLNKNDLDLPWLIGNLRQGYDNERANRESYKLQVIALENSIRDLKAQFDRMSLGDDPGDTGVLMVSREQHGRLEMMFRKAR